MILRSEGQLQFSPALREIYSADTFKLLLQIITSSQGQQNKSAVETFSGLVKSSGIILQSQMDLNLLLALVNEENSEVVTRAVVESIEKKSNLMTEIEELKFQEIWNGGENSGKMKVEDLFSAL